MTHTCRRICALLLTLCPQAALAAPNVVLIMSDDAGYADFGFMDRFTGQQTVFKTPNLDRLASQSVAFSNAYVPSSICSATRAGILTGRYPEKFAFGYNALPEDYPYEGWTVDQVTLMERLKELGYQTGVVGKWHLGEQPQWRPESQGVDYFYGFWEGGTNYYEGPPQVPIRRGATPIDWSAEPSFNNTPPDPSRGRYLTDALGDEASKYIAERAAGGQPFFLYLPFNGPHSPYDSKAQDDAQFVGSGLAGQRLTVASMTLAVDRAIGHVLSRIDDPNGDGDQSDSIADNTIVVFHNDNGGANVNYNNGPLAGYKGSGFEGGMRTPLLIRAPGLQPGVFDAPVTTLNLFPTLVTAAGGAMTTPADGVDLMPYLRGEVAGEPNPSIAYRNRANFAGIRKGQWKLTRPDALATWKLYRLNPDGSGEDVDLLAQHPEVASELIKEYVAFDVTLDKARNSGPWKVHTNDLFIRRNDAGPVTSWQHSTGWWNGDAPTLLASISREDPSPNFKLAFRPDANADYRSINDVNRASGIARNLLQQGLEDLPGLGEVMLNEIRLEGVFAGSANRKATIEGKPLLLVRDLAGKSPAIRLDAVQAAGPFTYTYNVDLDLYLYHDLVLEGDGNANFRIGGAMSSFDQPSGVTKRGTSNVTLTGHNTFTGELAIEQGEVTLDGAQAALDGLAAVHVFPGGSLRLNGGLIRTRQFVAPAGAFIWQSGRLVFREGFSVGPGGPLGSAVTLSAGQSLEASAVTTVGPGGTLELAGGELASGGLKLAGGVLKTSSLTGMGPLEFESGALVWIGDLEISPSGPLGGAVTLAADQRVQASGSLRVVGGSLTVAGGAAEASAVEVSAGGAVVLDGGSLTTGGLALAEGSFDWRQGRLAFTGDLVISPGGPLGATIEVTGGRTLATSETLRLGDAENAGHVAIRPGGQVEARRVAADHPQSTLLIDGGTLLADELQNFTGATLQWQTGTLSLRGDAQIAAGQALGDLVSLSAAHRLEVAGRLAIGGATPGSLVIGAGAVATAGTLALDDGGALTLDGGRIQAATIEMPSGAFQWNAGVVELTGDLAITEGAGLGPALALAGNQQLQVVRTLQIGGAAPGSLSIGAGAVVAADQVVINAGNLTLDGGMLTASSIQNQAGGTFSWQSGVLSLTGDVSIGSAEGLAGSLAMVGDQRLEVAGRLRIGPDGGLSIGAGSSVSAATASIEAGGVLTLAGGELSVASLEPAAAGAFIWQSGRLVFREGFSVGPGGPLGSAVTLSAGQSLEASAVTTVGPGGTLELAGGELASGGLKLAGGVLKTSSLTGMGPLEFESGALVWIGDLEISPSGPLGGAVTLAADQRVQASGSLRVVGGSLTVAGGAAEASAVEVSAGGAVVLDGGSLTTGGLALAEGSFDWRQGRLAFTGDLVISPGGPLGATIEVTGGRTLATSETLRLGDAENAGHVAIRPGGQVEARRVAADHPQSTLLIDGGNLLVDELGEGSPVDWVSGVVQLRGDAVLTPSSPVLESLGEQPVLGPSRSLVVAGEARLFTPLRLGGGSLSVGRLSNRHLLDADAGMLSLTGSDLSLGPGQPWGDTLVVPMGLTLDVVQNVAVEPLAYLRIAGGRMQAAALVNGGEIHLEGGASRLDAAQSMTNHALLRGSGYVHGDFVNAAEGSVDVLAGDRLRFSGSSFVNAGRISTIGTAAGHAEASFSSAVENSGGAMITGDNSRLDFQGGLQNAGVLALTGGENHVFGDIAGAGSILVTGGASATFYGDINNGGEFRVSAAGELRSSAVILGSFGGSGTVVGGGDVFIEGGLSPGESPAQVSYAADIFLGAGSRVVMELGGTAPGSTYDQIVVDGSVSLGGRLAVTLLDGFAPSAGDAFDIISASGGILGDFAVHDLPPLAGGLSWNLASDSQYLRLEVIGPDADFDDDGVVDGADFLQWQRQLGASGPAPVVGDANNDQQVDLTDLGVWAQQYPPAMAAGAMSAVPEPGALPLGLAALIPLVYGRGRRGLGRMPL